MPTGFPVWFWTILGVVLPLAYQSFLSKLPGPVKFLTSWGVSALIVVLVGVLILHYSPAQLVGAFVWLVASMQAVYTLMVKPAVKRLDSSKRQM